MPSITDSIGRVLGDRYRLVTALGTGASAHVYLADDVSLHRRVAIKVLHPALAGDTAFLKRFRAEARAVAALNHPNILQVYDWGEEDGEPYLVLEYLAGGSLRQVYDTGVLLTPEQAVQVGLEAAAGLDYAHRRGLVHRDIKPANLLFDADRRLRIADFGLARALAEASWTEPDGAILGTARYSAPEQVEGWVLDGKADVYALALVLYEGVTGEAPFIGDTTVATLMARVGTLLPEHEALGPLNDVLVWAAAPDPSERYDASQLAVRLQALAVALPAARAAADRRCRARSTRTAEVDQVMLRLSRRRAAAGDWIGPHRAGRPGTGRSRSAAGDNGKRPSDRSAGDPRPRAKRRWPLAGGHRRRGGRGPGRRRCGLRRRQARSSPPATRCPRWSASRWPEADRPVRATTSPSAPTGTATASPSAAGLILEPAPDARVRADPAVTAKQGSTIDVVVSAGPPPVAIPERDPVLQLQRGRPGPGRGPPGRGVPGLGRPVQLDGGGRRRPRHLARRTAPTARR